MASPQTATAPSFHVRWRGYDRHEVEAAMAALYASWAADKASYEDPLQLQAAGAEIADTLRALASSVANAQRDAQIRAEAAAARAEAEAESKLHIADTVIADAEARAKTMLDNAELDAAVIRAEVERLRAEATVALDTARAEAESITAAARAEAESIRVQAATEVRTCLLDVHRRRSTARLTLDAALVEYHALQAALDGVDNLTGVLDLSETAGPEVGSSSVVDWSILSSLRS